MQGFVYIFIALAALGVTGAAYYGLAFSPIESVITGLCFAAVAVALIERQLRQRSVARIERAIEDLGRLLATDAQAGRVLTQRINQLTELDAGRRLDSIEADTSVLGTVVRQLAESVAELEEKQRAAAPRPAATAESASPDDDGFPEPVIPVELLKQALADGRLVCHVEPIVQIPQRRTFAYTLVPRLTMEDGDFADPPDFMPRRGHADIVRRIEAIAFEQAIGIARRARTAGQPMRLLVPLTRATIADTAATGAMLNVLEANRVIAGALAFAIPQPDWKWLTQGEKIGLEQLSRTGVGFSLADATSLRFDFSELEGLGFTSVQLDATRFLRNPEHFTDFHSADVAPYAKRYRMDLIATGVIDEQQLLSLLDDGIGYIRGPHIAGPGPVRADLAAGRTIAPLRQAEA